MQASSIHNYASFKHPQFSTPVEADVYKQSTTGNKIWSLAVRFAMDRGGLVGADGATHGGAFDITYMACLPNMVVMAPSNEAELIHMVATSAAIDDRPSCFRYIF